MSSPLNSPVPLDYLSAIRLALASTANLESEHKVVEEILAMAPETPGEALWPTKILIDAIKSLDGSVDVP